MYTFAIPIKAKCRNIQNTAENFHLEIEYLGVFLVLHSVPHSLAVMPP